MSREGGEKPRWTVLYACFTEAMRAIKQEPLGHRVERALKTIYEARAKHPEAAFRPSRRRRP